MAIDLTIKIGGEGGEGVISSGDFLMQAATRAGMEVTTFKSFPAEIKGGYAMAQLRISDERILSHGDGFNIMVAFNGEAYEVNKSLLKPGTVLVYDGPEGADFEPEAHPGVHMYAVPMTKISKVDLNNKLAKNMVAMGALAELFKVPMDSLKSSVRDKFIRKGEEVVNANYAALDAGANYVKQNIKKTDNYTFPAPRPQKDVLIIEGNQAISLGLLAGGCRFMGCYPITPATSVANYLADLLPQANGFTYQAEDEIAAMATTLGASFTGVKSATVTSGPGLDLKAELIGLASMAEIPVTIVDVMRGGPSTGMPTKHDQSDLMMAVYGSHGDTPRVVLAAADVADCFYLAVEALNMAERYQNPIVLLSDASLSLRVEAIPRPDLSKIKIENRKVISKESVQEAEGQYRYKITESGVSPMALPGVSGKTYAATGLEHDQDSSPRTSPEIKVTMTEKRWRKFDNFEAENSHLCTREGDEKADLGIISWGLTQTMAREAVSRLRAKGYKVAALYPKALWPLPKKAIEEFGKSVRTVLVPEANVAGQFSDLIKAHTSVTPVKQVMFRGEPFIPVEIEEKAEEILKSMLVKA